MNAHSTHHDAFQDAPQDLRDDAQQAAAADADDHRRHVAPTTFAQTNLISDGFVPAQQTDMNLINPWGVAYGPGGPFWISENNSGFSSIDSVMGGTATLNVIPPVTIAPPTPGAGPASPTGQVFNSFASTGAFTLQDGKPASYLFATEDGAISGWNGGTQSIIAVNESANPADGSEALGLGTVDMFDQNFNQVKSFTDKNLPAGYAPFNAQVLDNKLFVTFALQNDTKHDDVAGAGNGFVDEFDLEGHLLNRVASGGPLNSSWGLAIAPSGFATFGGDLLVGNFGDGTIDAFDLKHDDAFVGKLTDASGNPIVIPELWELLPGNGGAAGNTNTIFFTAGVKDEAHGLFGSLTPNATPSQAAAIAPGSNHLFG